LERKTEFPVPVIVTRVLPESTMMSHASQQTLASRALLGSFLIQQDQ
jgi:hypothetical protein